MEAKIVALNQKKILRFLAYTAVFNTIIAIFLTSIKFGAGFVTNFIFSQCVGISICSCILTALYFLKPASRAAQLITVIIAMITGSVVGQLLGSIFSGMNPFIALHERPGHIIQAILMAILFGTIITHFFFSREKISATETLVQEEKIKRLTIEKKAAETHLRLLQAQIEPHFLFNTLSNILSLLETDLEKGKSMLVDLNHYLRTTLSKARADITTLGQEMEMIQAYLNIYKIRMGNRLNYSIEVPERLRDLPFPPMLAQPLVENAIKHGLEPRIEGGEILIMAEQEKDILRLEIADTGLGFNEGSIPDTGLTNIRERLQTLYDDNKGRLLLEENQPSGLKAVIEVPIA
ncbi:MAG: histidine kinase [Deltaproteobacteria bacterium]|nr:histidine kinase [Deltaproteobacteria bacterium]